jgi:hypothetical protein
VFVVDCDVRLQGLFGRSFAEPNACMLRGATVTANWLREYAELDTQVAIGSLPRFLRQSWSDFPQHSGYLRADPARVTHWRSRLASLGAGAQDRALLARRYI